MGELLHLVQRGGAWAWAGCGPASPLLAVPNVTAHPSTASVAYSILLGLYDSPLLCGFNVAIKVLNIKQNASRHVVLYNSNYIGLHGLDVESVNTKLRTRTKQ